MIFLLISSNSWNSEDYLRFIPSVLLYTYSLKLNSLNSCVDRAAQQGEKTKIAEGPLDSLLWLTSAIAKCVHNSGCNPDQTSACSNSGMRKASSTEKEEELRQIFKSILVTTLNTVKHLVVTVHIWIFYFVLLPCLSNFDTLPHCHKDGTNTCQNDITIILGNRHSWHLYNDLL